MADPHNGKDLPGESGIVGREDAEPVFAAVAKVMRECSLSEPRLRGAIQRAMQTEASKTDEAPDWNGIAERMIAAHASFLEFGRADLLKYQIRMRRFFAEGIWRDQGLWPIDTELARMRRRL